MPHLTPAAEPRLHRVQHILHRALLLVLRRCVIIGGEALVFRAWRNSHARQGSILASSLQRYRGSVVYMVRSPLVSLCCQEYEKIRASSATKT